MIWSFSPFVTEKKRFYTCVLFARLLMVLVGEPAKHLVLAVPLSRPALRAAADMLTCCSVHLPVVELLILPVSCQAFQTMCLPPALPA